MKADWSPSTTVLSRLSSSTAPIEFDTHVFRLNALVQARNTLQVEWQKRRCVAIGSDAVGDTMYAPVDVTHNPNASSPVAQ